MITFLKYSKKHRTLLVCFLFISVPLSYSYTENTSGLQKKNELPKQPDVKTTNVSPAQEKALPKKEEEPSGISSPQTSDLKTEVSDEEEMGDEIFLLSDFYVTAEKGYQSSHSVSASMFAEEIGRTPNQIEVLTRDFMDDIGADSIKQALQYATNVKPGLDATGTSAQTYTIRGLTSNRPSRNFSAMSYPPDRYNIQRVEVIQGPAALAYGRSDPGGLVNMTSKVPNFTSPTEVELAFGSYDYYRASFDTNIHSEDVAFRVNAVYHDEEDWRLYEYKERRAITAHALFKFGDNTVFRIEAEQGLSRQNPSRGVFIYEGKFVEDEHIVLPDSTVVKIPYETAQSHMGKDSHLDYDWNLLEFTLQNSALDDKLNSQLTLYINNVERSVQWLAGSEYIKNNNFVWIDGVQQRDQNNQPIREDGLIQVDPQRHVTKFETISTRADTSYKIEENFGKIRLLAGVRYDRGRSDTELFRPLAPTANVPWFPNRFTWKVEDIGKGIAPLFDGSSSPSNFESLYERTDKTDSMGGYTSLSGEFFNNRLNVLGGVRYDNIEQSLGDQTSRFDNPGYRKDGSKQQIDNTTMALGFVYQVFPGVGLFANYGEAFQVNVQRDFDNNYLPPRETSGIDLGVKFKLFDNKLTGSLYAFKIENKNNSEVVPLPLRPEGNVGGVNIATEQESKGFGLDFVARPMRGLSVRGGYGYIDVIRTLGFEEYGLPTGHTVPGNSKHNFNLFANYAFTAGPLKNFSVGLGANYASKTVAGYLDTDSDDIPDEEYTVPGYLQFNGMFNYRKKFKRFTWVAAFNVNNIFDTEYIRPLNTVTATRSEARSFILTNRITF